MFQWTEGADRKVRPTRGFYAIASRFRQNELAAYAALLEESAMSAELRRFTGQSGAPSIVHAIAPKDQLTMPIILMMMMLQFGLLALLVWSTMGGARKEETAKLTDLEKKVADLKTALENNSPSDVQAEVLDRVLREMKETDRGTVQRIQQQARKVVAQEAALEGHEVLRKDLQKTKEIQELAILNMEKELLDVKDKLKNSKDRIAQVEGDLNEATAGKSANWRTVFSSPWAWGGMFAAAFIGAGIAIVPNAVKQRQEEIEAEKVTIEPRPMDS
jgi:hypothetical protein